MPRAVWNGAVLAESEQTTVVDGHHYFPAPTVRWEHLVRSTHTSVCGWKGVASYYTVVVDGQENPDSAWTYRAPSDAAAHLAGQIGFWRGVDIERTTTVAGARAPSALKPGGDA